MIFTGSFGLDVLLLYKIEKRSSSIAGKISVANICAHEFSSVFFSQAVSEIKLSSNDTVGNHLF